MINNFIKRIMNFLLNISTFYQLFRLLVIQINEYILSIQFAKLFLFPLNDTLKINL